ncbi:hypothetical protein [Variovorax paradoxus]|uniref:hypothetical protein n=1 Tax=Variovorax paradoxus TaxID=34073 RepID=UPI003D66094B
MSNYGIIVTVRPTRQPIDTAALFDASYAEAKQSPVDQFLENCLALNRQWSSLGPTEEVVPEVSRLILVGYVSAVEGYMRSLIRKLIHCDPYAQALCATQQLSYAAALHHEPDMLPDALLEEVSFSTQKEIEKSLPKYIGLKGLSAGSKRLVEEFDQILHLRHCCTHRFGKLGAKNATALGLQTHSSLLEKPVKLSKAALESVADLTFTMVKSINNDVFTFVLHRAATERLPDASTPGLGWKWNKAQDRKMFARYYDMFASTRDAQPSPTRDSLYELFRAQYRKVGATSAKPAGDA